MFKMYQMCYSNNFVLENDNMKILYFLYDFYNNLKLVRYR